MLGCNTVEQRALHAVEAILQTKGLTNQTQLGSRPANLLSTAADLRQLNADKSRKGQARKRAGQDPRLGTDAGRPSDSQSPERVLALAAATAIKRKAG